MKKIVMALCVISIVTSALFAGGSKEDAGMKKDTGMEEKSMSSDTTMDKDEYRIAIVMDKGQNSSKVKRITDALTFGLSRFEIEGEVLDFIATKDAQANVFTDYDAVVAINEETTDALSASILAFVQEYKDNPKLVVVAVLPNSKSSLTNPPAGIDVLSSASQKADASTLMVEEVSPAIKGILDGKM